MVEKNGEEKNAYLITKKGIKCGIEECEFGVYLGNCGIKECSSDCGHLGVKIAHWKIELTETNSKNSNKTFDHVTYFTKNNEPFYAKNAHLKVANFD